MNPELEIQKIRLQAYNERYTALVVLSITLTTRLPKDRETEELQEKALATLNSLRNDLLEMISLTESAMRRLK